MPGGTTRPRGPKPSPPHMAVPQAHSKGGSDKWGRELLGVPYYVSLRRREAPPSDRPEALVEHGPRSVSPGGRDNRTVLLLLGPGVRVADCPPTCLI